MREYFIYCFRYNELINLYTSPYFPAQSPSNPSQDSIYNRVSFMSSARRQKARHRLLKRQSNSMIPLDTPSNHTPTHKHHKYASHYDPYESSQNWFEGPSVFRIQRNFGDIIRNKKDFLRVQLHNKIYLVLVLVLYLYFLQII